MFKIVNIKSKTNKKIHFKINGTEEENEEAIANAFNSYFIKIGTQLDKEMPKAKTCPKSYLKGTYEQTMYLKPCDEQEIEKHIHYHNYIIVFYCNEVS